MIRRSTAGVIRVQAIGRLELLPESTLAAIRAAESATADYDAMLLSIAVAYGGREEIADAVRDMLTQALNDGVPFAEVIEHICPERIGRHLYLAETPEPDLIIRTSGELRLSGFMLWQSAYSEFYFSDVTLAGVPQDRLPARCSSVPATAPALWPLTEQVLAQAGQVGAQEGPHRTLQHGVLILQHGLLILQHGVLSLQCAKLVS